ncbi:MAG: GNAT family N-acetyltransferase [Vulcanimicrobiaceae bacterium]
MVRLRIVPLDPNLHDRGAFTCGNANVDRFLQSTAAQQAKYLKSGTFVLLRTDSEQQILGFYTLAQHGYRDSELNDVTARLLKVQGLKSIPTILLGQLGVATDFQGSGLGRFLLRDALGRSLSVAQEIGGVAIITDPYDAKARDFYARFAFQVLHEHPFLRMLLPMRTLAKSVAQTRARGVSFAGTERL